MESISKRIANLSPEKQQLLLSLLKKEGVAAPPLPISPRTRESDSYPLSFAQQRLWFLDQFEPGSPLYNITNAVRLVGELNLSALNQSISNTVSRHEVLRTTFAAEDGRPVQVIHPQMDVALPVVDLSAVADHERMAEIRRLSLQEAQAPFDLSKGPLLRITVLRVGGGEHFALVTMHHIISDAWSMGILIQEISTLYNALSKSSSSPLASLPIQYADFATWQREMLDGESLSTDLAYWKKQLDGVPSVLELPTDWPRPSVQTFRGANQSFALSAELSRQLHEFSLNHDATLFMTLLAAFQTLLYRYSSQNDFCVGTPIAGRTRIETEGLIGFFINTLALRADYSGNPNFTQLLKRVRETVLGAQAHQELPFEKLVEELQPERSLSHTPLFQVMFTLQNAPRETLKLEGLTLSASTVNSGTSRFDLNVEMGEIGGKLLGSISYNTDLYDGPTITRMIGHFLTLLDSLSAFPEQPVNRANLLPAAELQQIIVGWNETQRDYPSEKCIHELFEQQAEQWPNHIALLSGDDKLTYSELNGRANQLARHLSGLGVGPDVTVGVCLERSLDLIIALLGILKAGGAYVPLDPAYPLNRLDFMLGDSAIPVLLTQERLIDKLPTSWAQVVCLDTQREEISRERCDNLNTPVLPDNLAYVIYTSGSTGQPKGVCVSHRAVSRLVINNSFAELSPAHTLLQFAPVAFDASTFEIWGALLNGARLVIAPAAVASLLELAETIKTHQVTTAWLTAGLFHLFVEERLHDLAPLTQVLAGGDVLSARHVQRVLDEMTGLRVINGYGPTEATTFSCCEAMESGSRVGGSVLIGGPIGNTQVYVLDEQMGVVPEGVEGELYIAGEGLARGYLNSGGETAEKFVPNPYGERGGERMYRSGDRVRWRSGGKLEFRGRQDRQVKVRGYRVELGEVEKRLGEEAGVREAVVEVRGEGEEKRLVGYVVWKEGEGRRVGELREGLKKKVPEYMVPSVVVEVEELPLTGNGKVDRAALPDPQQARERLEKQYVQPRSSIESLLAQIWSQVLGVKQIGIHDNFFELGGDSIISLQIVARATQAGLQLTTKHIFQCQTIAELALMAETATIVPAEQGEISGEVELSPIQCWFFDKIKSHLHHYNQAVLLESLTDLNPAIMRAALARLLVHHDALRARFTPSATGWKQFIAPAQSEVPFSLADLSNLPVNEQRRAIEAVGAAAHASLDLRDGPLLRVVLMRLASGKVERLLIVIHHLVVDGVSWRVILEDLQSLYEQMSRAAKVELPAKTSSYQQWSRQLGEYAESEEVKRELAYWTRAKRRQVSRLPVDEVGGSKRVGESRMVGVRLSADETRALLQEVPGVYRTQINDVLLSALAQAFADWTGHRSLIVAQDAHGREEILKDIDVTRTVGFFTATFPMYLEVPEKGGPGDVLKAIKEQVRELPKRGVGYGVLRYLSGRPEVRDELAKMPEAEVSFNYLGQFDQVLEAGGMLRGGREGSGPSRNEEQERVHLIDVIARVAGGRLWVGWEYSEGVHRRETIKEVAERYAERLREIIEHCRGEEAGGYTKSDFELARLGQEKLDELYGKDGQIEDIYPLSPMQQGMLFHMLYEPASGAYFVQTSYGLRGAFNKEAFKQAWVRVIERHAVLRTSFEWEGVEEPVQVVHKRVGLPLEELDWRGKSQDEQPVELEAYLESDRRRGFELTQAPLMRLTLIRLESDFYYFIWGYHHLIADGWSGAIIQNEALAYYQALNRNQEVSPERARPYRDYIAWLQRQDLTSAESFWRQELKGFSAPTPLGLDHLTGREIAGSRAYQSRRIRLSENTLALAKQAQLTLNTLVQGAWALILSIYSGEPDIVFGVTSSGRPAEIAGIEDMVGLFINTMPQRVQVYLGAKLDEWLKEVQSRQLEIRDYEYSPLLQVQGWSDIARGAALFESILVSEKYPVPAEASEEPAREQTAPVQTKDVAIRDVRTTEHTHYPLTIEFVAAPELLLRIGYDCRRFDDTTIARIMSHFQTALESMGEDPQQRLAGVQILPRAEREQLLVEWNATNSRQRLDIAFHQLFEQQMERTPDAIAVSCENDKLTYRQLNERANRLARQLSARGIGPESLVGLLDERGNNFLTAILAVFKAGGAYLPLDPLYPALRTAQVLAQSRAKLVLTGEKFYQELLRNLDDAQADYRPEVGLLEQLLAEEAAADNLPVRTAPANLAYVIYTSGSTGIPKGAMVEQGGMLNHLYAKIAALGLVEGDVIAQTASQSFDISVWQFLAALLVGGRVHVIKDGIVHDAALLLAELDNQTVSILETVPSLMRVILDEERRGSRSHNGLANLRWMIPTGEALPVELCREWLRAHPQIPLMNAYGPTECSDDVTHQVIRVQPANHELRVPIGRPVENMKMYIVDDQWRPVPLGAAGELLVGGVGVGRGYLYDSVRTCESFIPDPFSLTPGARLYKTGDLVRYLTDGNIEFLGRKDFQVKVRGYRIELGEIEEALSNHADVKEAAVAVMNTGVADSRLVAYIVPAFEDAPESRELQNHLKERLPDYMVPSTYVTLGALPLTANGKVDRRALPLPEPHIAAPQDELAPTLTPVQEMLLDIWKEVFGHEQIGIDDNFFDLGGHSLLATQVISRARKTFQIDLPLRLLFETPTIRELAVSIEEEKLATRRHKAPPVRAITRDGLLPVSFAQERLWFFHQLDPQNPFYNMPKTVRLRGQLNLHTLERTFNEIIKRHETLRTIFTNLDGQPYQIIQPAASISIPIIDLSEVPTPEREAEALRLAREESLRPFDLSRGPLLRVSLLRISDNDHILIFLVHHIASDGWSVAIFTSEITAIYRALVSGESSPLPELPLQYADYAAWQRDWLQGEVLDEQLSYWRRTLEDLPELRVPTDYPRPLVPSFRGETEFLRLSPELSQALRELSRSQGVTLYMTMLAAFKVLLHHYTGQHDIVVGSAIANRTSVEAERLIGFFVNTQAMRTDLSGDPMFTELVGRVRDMALGAYANQDVPFEKVVQEVQPERYLSRMPLFQVAFSHQNIPHRKSSPVRSNLTMSEMNVASGTARCDLTIYITEEPNGLSAALEYSTDLFENHTILAMLSQYRTLLEGVVANPVQPISKLPLLADEDRRQLLVEWNDTRIDFPKGEFIHRMFEAQAARTPDHAAVVLGDERFTYEELDRRANQLARHLASLGVGPEVIVGICMERSLEMVVALLGVLKAGGAFLPLDPAYPMQRLTFMIEDARPPVILSQDRLAERIPWHDGQNLYLDTDWEVIDRESGENPRIETISSHLAYVIYTSGSTGQPKGVMVSHGSISNTMHWRQQTYRLSEHDHVIQNLSFSFDPSIWQFFAPLAVGAQLVLIPPGAHQDNQQIIEAIQKHKVTALQMPPSILQLFLQEERLPDCDSLRLVIYGGEALSLESQERFFARLGGELHNLYGPTEAAIDATAWPCRPAVDPKRIPIGRPIANTEVYILNANLEPVPVGVPGELCIAGFGLARGYLNRADLTAERFIPNPFSTVAGARLYRTGDLARYLPDGNIDFMGRLDDQIKLRGFRIELEEIKAVIDQHPAVKDNVVILREDIPGDKRLAAYVVQNTQYMSAQNDAQEVEGEFDQVLHWQMLYEDSYGQTDSEGDDTFNISGWNSSYTGEPIGESEMREWVDATVAQIVSLEPRRVLEIGCGTGLLLFRVAPGCEQYVATDFSREVLRYVDERLSRPGRDLKHVTLIHRMADNFEDLAPESFDTIILNSVAQYFPSINYLVRVLEQAVAAVTDGGTIFLGDIRSLPLLEAFHASVQLYQTSTTLSVPQLRQRVQKQMTMEEELVIDPQFFLALQKHLPKISTVEVRLKRGHSLNELTKFRYDVVLHVGGKADAVDDLRWLDWQEQGLSLAALQSLLEEKGQQAIGLDRVPNARLYADVKTTELLGAPGSLRMAGDLRESFKQLVGTGIDPEALWVLGEQLGYRVDISWLGSEADGAFKAIFRRPEAEVSRPISFDSELLPGQDWTDYANNPLQGMYARKLIPELTGFLEEKLPDYMVPSAIVLLNAIPLNSNGKVDLKALPEPDQSRSQVAGAYVAPRTPLEAKLAEIWGSVLSLEQVGIHDNFFQLGGHSLMVTQVMSRIREVFNTELPLATLFQSPTIAGLAECLGSALQNDQMRARPPILPVPRNREIPLSFAQQRLWFIHQLEPDSSAYNMPVAVRFQGELNLPAIEQTFNEITRRHETLRTSFPMIEGRPVQVIAPPRPFALTLVDLGHLPEQERMSEARRLANGEAQQPFDLKRGPLMRVKLVRVSPQEHVLIVTLHHIVGDGWSLGVMVGELTSLYGAICEGAAAKLAELAVQYADYAVWQREWMAGEVLQEQLSYWQEKLGGEVPVLRLPVDREASEAGKGRLKAVGMRLSEELSGKVKKLSEREGVTMFMMLLAGFKALLYRYSGQSDIILGTPIAGRSQIETESLIGFFLNTLALRTDLSGNPSFRELLGRVRETALGAQAHQDAPYDKLVEVLQPDRSLSRAHLFQVWFVLQNAPMGSLHMPGLNISTFEPRTGAAQFDLVLSMTETGQRISGSLEYNADLFDEDTIVEMGRHLESLFRSVTTDPNISLLDIRLDSEVEFADLDHTISETDDAESQFIF